MGFVESISTEKEWKPSSQSEEGNQSVEFDWIGIPAPICAGSLDRLGIDNWTRAKEEIDEEIGGSETIERRRPGRMYGDRNGEECL
jgi:hypothetical protein